MDESNVMPLRKAKSISNEITFSTDECDLSVHHATLLKLSDKVGYRLRKRNMMARTIFLKIRLSDFSTMVRHTTLSTPTQLSEVILREIKSLFHATDLKGQSVRLLGVGVTQLNMDSERQTDLFETDHEKQGRATAAIDKLKQKYGEKIIKRG